jgi:cyclic pyranopterin phosphate synthase
MNDLLKPVEAAQPVRDGLGRALRDLRVSVTDRCNFRCVYCMPKEVFGKDYQFLERRALLSFEEIARLVRIFSGQGVAKVRLTGGEPLVRRNLEQLIVMLAAIPDLDITSNRKHAHCGMPGSDVSR